MELPNVLNKLTHKEESSKEYFWAFEVWDSGVKSAIWTVEDGKTKVVSIGSHEVWDETVESLIEATDKSLATASEKFFQEGDQQPSKVIFGLPYNWIENDKINPEYQQKLQQLCEQLELQAVGFVLSIDAINHQIKAVEGIPPSLILINPQKTQVLVAILSQGKVEMVEQVVRSEDLAADVYEGLLRSQNKDFPARMLLFNGNEDLKKAQEILTNFAWQPALPFLHFPRIDVLPSDFDITAVCLSGGSEVARSLGFEVTGAVMPEQVEEQIEEEKNVFQEDPSQPEQSLVETVETVEEPPVVSDLVENKIKTEGGEPHPDFGFVQGEDVRETATQEIKTDGELPQEPDVVPVEPENFPDFRQEVSSEIHLPTNQPQNSKKRFPLPSLSLFGVIGSTIKGISLPRFKGAPMFLAFGGGFIFLVLAIATAFLWFLTKAEVVLIVSPKNLEKEFELRIDPNQEVIDNQNLILPGQVIEKEIEDELSELTTGKKTVGDKAKGEVTIKNSGNTRNLSAGTTLTGPGSLKFVLDEDVTVASSSGIFSPAEVKAKVTAANIGADYNIAADSAFTIGNLDRSTVGAISTSAFTGGTSRQIQVVSEEDQKKLVSRLTEDLKEKLQIQMKEEVPDGANAVESSFTAKEVSRNFNHKVDDEASELTLSLKLKGMLLSFSEDEFLALAQEQLKDSVPEGYTAKKENIEPVFEVKKQEKDGSVLFKVLVSASLMPRINPDEIAANVKGKYPNVAREYLAGLPGFIDAQISLKPDLPAQIATLPRQVKNISVEIRGQ